MNTLVVDPDPLAGLAALLDERVPSPAARPHYLRWARLWHLTAAPDTREATDRFFEETGRRPGLEACHFAQAVRAVAWLARDILRLPWAAEFDWRGLAYATETTYVHWNGRFTRFCLARLGQTPQDAGPPGVTAYLDYLALERNVSASTQKQALNAMVFLLRHVFGLGEFVLDKPNPGHTQRRPPTVLTRGEITAILGHADVSTTMIYLHVLKRPGAGAPSPMDLA